MCILGYLQHPLGTFHNIFSNLFIWGCWPFIEMQRIRGKELSIAWMLGTIASSDGSFNGGGIFSMDLDSGVNDPNSTFGLQWLLAMK